MEEKIFIGSTTTKHFDNGGSIIKIGIRESEIEEHLKNGWLNITVSKRREAQGDEKDYYACVDTYEPKKEQKKTDIANEVDTENIPF